jgi:hypothetical protein
MSVTGWFVMQLKSARMAGLRPDGSGLQGAMNFVDEVSTPDGWTGYTSRGSGRYCLTAVGLVSRQFMGAAAGDPALARAADHLLKELPDWNTAGTVKNKGGDIGFYYWYYGTLGMFQMGGDHWKKWNEAIKPTLVNNQCKGPLPLSGEVTDKDGSWDPQSWIDPYGGRVFTTALGALTLEVYYRYLPMYGK